MCLISENHIKQWFVQRECLDGTLKLSESTEMGSTEAIFHCLGEHLRSTKEPRPNCCYWKYVLMHMKVNCPENLQKAKTTPQVHVTDCQQMPGHLLQSKTASIQRAKACSLYSSTAWNKIQFHTWVYKKGNAVYVRELFIPTTGPNFLHSSLVVSKKICPASVPKRTL